MCIYLLIGTVIFAECEHWNYLDSAYFCVTSLMKIGFGDLVPGTSDQDGSSSMHEVKLVVNFVYILLGKDHSIIWMSGLIWDPPYKLWPDLIT